MRDFYLKLDDGVIVYPGHGAGSPCGADIGDRLSSMIGHERRFNAFLQYDEVKPFTDYALSTAPTTPTYYPRMKKVNAKGPEISGNLPIVRGLPLESIRQMPVHEVKREGKRLQVLDVRAPDEWEGGHIPNANHVFLGELREHLGKLDRTKPTAVYCDSGYRASIATSILKQAGSTVSAIFLEAGKPGKRRVSQSKE